MTVQSTTARQTAAKLADRSAVVGIIGLGYVGLPVAIASTRAGFITIGFDVDRSKIERLTAGISYIGAVESEELYHNVSAGRFSATNEFAHLSSCDVIVICVPTPLSKNRGPDLKFVIDTTTEIAKRLRIGQLIVLESTTYPGTTEEVVKPILSDRGLVSGQDYFLAYSPEREDPGNKTFKTAAIPKVVSGEGPDALALAQVFYGAIVKKVVPVSTLATAEAVKITENVFRAVNIALVNELKTIYDAMGIDVWEVIDAAATKPFGFMPFYPGPGLGGHCIPIDPFYLSWKSREYGLNTRFIELAGEVNLSMPRYVISNLEAALDKVHHKSLSSSKILIVGMAYKKNVDDIRESPSLVLFEMLQRRGAKVEYHDNYIPEILPSREHSALAGNRTVDITAVNLSRYDAVLISTDHDDVDYAQLAEFASLIVDSRNAMGRRGFRSEKIIRT